MNKLIEQNIILFGWYCMDV